MENPLPDPRPPGSGPDAIMVPAKHFYTEAQIQLRLQQIGMDEAKDMPARLQGISMLDDVRKALLMPQRTLNTAIQIFHRFRLLHAITVESGYVLIEVACACLLLAAKIEDTLKKPREIVCAAHNMGKASSEHINSDDPILEASSKNIVALERQMLEAIAFDFKFKSPQAITTKFGRKYCGFTKEDNQTSWHLAVDIYRTWGPLKHTYTDIALACCELAGRLLEKDMTVYETEHRAKLYGNYQCSRLIVLEILLDLIDLYQHHRNTTKWGQKYPPELWTSIQSSLESERAAANLPRYRLSPQEAENLAAARENREPRNFTNPGRPIGSQSQSAALMAAIGARSQTGTVRFLFNSEAAREEERVVSRFFEDVYEEVEVEIDSDGNEIPGTERPVKRSRLDRGSEMGPSGTRDE
ncbi:cyclin-like protein [Eremomyces bilateralis CBS 781.70]|uniref:RNA polymerase II holoenzyme cyclin-like subunit n=1 Tax=Eremomyces bilateralis CBS 781.70 TaxID=1392243 RepID=A0A6G1G156_9PEZI|nr:cyclin-like protein [Eremomyces bilateralis CBS 781.70]KAF1811661.1 cyclin-like protein [Eremomyces bilateralis CBS 781.70]